MLEDIVTLDSKDISTVKYKSADVDPGIEFSKEVLDELRDAWSKRQDVELTPSLDLLAVHVKDMYKLMKEHTDKQEIQEYITRYRRLMLGLNKLGVIEPDYYEGKA